MGEAKVKPIQKSLQRYMPAKYRMGIAARWPGIRFVVNPDPKPILYNLDFIQRG